jgi:hypothetical protein
MFPNRAAPHPLTLLPSQLTSEDSFQIAVSGVQGLRVEIVADGPPPEEEAP